MSYLFVVEDEHHLAEGLRFNLEADGHTVAIEDNGTRALQRLLAAGDTVDAIILDVMLPGLSGFDVVRALREAGNYTPVLMLTARGRSEDVLQGFDAGADDYLPKPFELAILLARVRGLLRRRQWAQRPPSDDVQHAVLTFHGRTLDLEALELRVGTTTHHLTQMESDLLAYLIRNAGKAVSRKAILEDVWALREDTDTRAIDNFIVRLRRYIEDDPGEPTLLLTVRGIGYKLMPDDPAASVTASPAAETP
jgi:DNA-binding response OmpR family regulator